MDLENWAKNPEDDGMTVDSDGPKPLYLDRRDSLEWSNPLKCPRKAVWRDNFHCIKEIHDVIKVHRVENVQGWVEWVLRPEVASSYRQANGEPGNLSTFFIRLSGNDESVVQAFRTMYGNQRKKRVSKPKYFYPRNSVYISSLVGGPYGHAMEKLIGDRRRTKGVIAAFYGRRNPVACGYCAARAASCTMVLNPDGHESRVARPLPFDECVSIPWAWGGSCANCLFHVDSTSCDYKILSEMDEPCPGDDSDSSGIGPAGFEYDPEVGRARANGSPATWQVPFEARRSRSSLLLRSGFPTGKVKMFAVKVAKG